MKSGLFAALALLCLSALTVVLFFGRLAVPVDLAASTRPAAPPPKPLRVGTVEMERVFAALPATKEVQGIVAARRTAILAEQQPLKNIGKPKRAEHFKKRCEEDLAREMAGLAREINVAIQDRIAVLARRRKLDLVFNSDAQSLRGVRVLLAAGPGFDLTDELLNDPELLGYRILPR